MSGRADSPSPNQKLVTNLGDLFFSLNAFCTRLNESLISSISALNENPAKPSAKSADISMALGPTAPANI